MRSYSDTALQHLPSREIDDQSEGEEQLRKKTEQNANATETDRGHLFLHMNSLT